MANDGDEVKATKLTVRLPPELHERLAVIAEDDKRSLNNLIVFMLDAATRQHGTRKTGKPKGREAQRATE